MNFLVVLYMNKVHLRGKNISILRNFSYSKQCFHQKFSYHSKKISHPQKKFL